MVECSSEAAEFDSAPRDESFSEGPLECDTETLFARTKELADAVAARHPKIVIEECYTKHTAAAACPSSPSTA